MLRKNGEDATLSQYLGQVAAEVLLCDREQCTPQEHVAFVRNATERAVQETRENR